MRLAVFADGTWNKIEPDGSGTNVVKLYRLALNDRAKGQIAFYDAGVGNSGFDKIRGGLFGMGLSKNITDCYRFLVQEWAKSPEPHEILLFGFSRGAYTVRSLAGLLGRVGLVKSEGDVDRAYDVYRLIKSQKKRDVEEREWFLADKVRTMPRIAMIGVWDTVGALGIPLSWVNDLLNLMPHKFHDTGLGKHIDAAYHAVSVDEERVSYAPTLWDPLPEGARQKLEQVYFPGVHSDVGGGYKDDRRLGDITLRWMTDRAVERGLLLDRNQQPPEIDQTHAYGKIHEPMKYLPIRRARRPIQAKSWIARYVEERRKAPRGAFDPYPYNPPNLRQSGAYRIVP
jgi:uncharacterized protein (DUF2235 family)